jgi:hypothetical protein
MGEHRGEVGERSNGTNIIAVRAMSFSFMINPAHVDPYLKY